MSSSELRATRRTAEPFGDGIADGDQLAFPGLARTKRATVTCPTCDVTWRGEVKDECWSCGDRESGVVQAAPQVRIRA